MCCINMQNIRMLQVHCWKAESNVILLCRTSSKQCQLWEQTQVPRPLVALSVCDLETAFDRGQTSWFKTALLPVQGDQHRRGQPMYVCAPTLKRLLTRLKHVKIYVLLTMRPDPKIYLLWLNWPWTAFDKTQTRKNFTYRETRAIKRRVATIAFFIPDSEQHMKKIHF